MKDLLLYANYGCIAAEKQVIWTYGSPVESAVLSEKYRYKIPEGWKTYETVTGEYAIRAPWGESYHINDILCGNNEPEFRLLDKNQKQVVVKLKKEEILHKRIKR